MSREEDLELLQAVRNWKPPKTVHPSALLAVQLYEANGMSLPDEAMQTLRSMIEAYGENLVGRAEALEGLTRFLMFMQAKGDTVTEGKLFTFLRESSKVFEPFWQRVGEALENVGEEGRSLFFKFVDANQGPENKVAPKFGAEAPEGSVPLREMMPPPGRPPPWAKKTED